MVGLLVPTAADFRGPDSKAFTSGSFQGQLGGPGSFNRVWGQRRLIVRSPKQCYELLRVHPGVFKRL